MEENTDEILLGKVKAGDLKAYEKLMNSHLPRIKAYIAYSLPFQEVVNDLTQEVFIFASQNIDDFKEGNFGAWLKAVARNLVRREFTRMKRRSYNRENYEKWLVVQNEVPLEHADTAALEECLAKLKKEHRELVNLRYVQTFNSLEISKKINKSHAWVRTTLCRVRDNLRTCLGEANI